jgi:hypothetical protein
VAAIKGPFTYEALPPEQIEFVPLNQTKKMNGKQLMEFYEVRGEVTGGALLLIRYRKTSTSAASCPSFAIPRSTP